MFLWLVMMVLSFGAAIALPVSRQWEDNDAVWLVPACVGLFFLVGFTYQWVLNRFGRCTCTRQYRCSVHNYR